MLNHVLVPPSFALIKKGRVSLLLKEGYKDLLLQQGIEDFETFLKKYGQISPHLRGRTYLFSAPLKDGRKMVIRRYSHGGWFRFFTSDLYLCGSRSFQELCLTEEIRSSGISTIESIGAVHVSIFRLLYRAYLLSVEIPEAEDSTRYLLRTCSQLSPTGLTEKRRMIRSAGLLLQQFHRAGFFHRDLQLKNILIEEGQPYLIDFDRSYRRRILTLEEKINNLLRLNRSAEKWKGLGLPLTKTDRWRFFSAYSEGDPELRDTLRKMLQTYSIRLFFHRCFWTLHGVVKGAKGRGVQ